MNHITEIIPDDIPDWARKDMADGQFWNRVFARVTKLENRISNLEGWSAEMYENHRIELARLQSIIDQGKYRKELDQTYIVKLKAQLAALYKK